MVGAARDFLHVSTQDSNSTLSAMLTHGTDQEVIDYATKLKNADNTDQDAFISAVEKHAPARLQILGNNAWRAIFNSRKQYGEKVENGLRYVIDHIVHGTYNKGQNVLVIQDKGDAIIASIGMNREPVVRMAEWICEMTDVTVSDYDNHAAFVLLELIDAADGRHGSYKSRPFPTVTEDYRKVCDIFGRHEPLAGLLPHAYPKLRAYEQGKIIYNQIMTSPLILRHLLAKAEKAPAPGLT